MDVTTERALGKVFTLEVEYKVVGVPLRLKFKVKKGIIMVNERRERHT